MFLTFHFYVYLNDCVTGLCAGDHQVAQLMERQERHKAAFSGIAQSAKDAIAVVKDKAGQKCSDIREFLQPRKSSSSSLISTVVDDGSTSTSGCLNNLIIYITI